VPRFDDWFHALQKGGHGYRDSGGLRIERKEMSRREGWGKVGYEDATMLVQKVQE